MLQQDTGKTLSISDTTYIGQCLEFLIIKYPEDLNQHYKKLLHFFSDYLVPVSQQKDRQKLIYHLIKSLNYLLANNAQNFVFKAKDLANQLVQPMADIWRQSNESLKLEIIQFFRIVFRLKLDQTNDTPVECIHVLYQMVKDAIQQRLFSLTSKKYFD